MADANQMSLFIFQVLQTLLLWMSGAIGALFLVLFLLVRFLDMFASATESLPS